MDMAVGTTQRKIAETLARSDIYQFLSHAFFYPQADFFAALGSQSELAAELEECVCCLYEDILPDGESPLRQRLNALFSTFNATLLEALEVEYQRAFSHTTSEVAPPYETQYGTAHIFQQMQAMGDIGGFYQAFGLDRSHLAKERIDHIAIELEFMYFLTYKEAYALTHHGQEKGEFCREAQKQFLHEHLGRWVPVFARMFREKVGHSFYAELAAFTAQFLEFEAKWLGIQPDVANAPQPIEMEFDENCMTCGLNDVILADPQTMMRDT